MLALLAGRNGIEMQVKITVAADGGAAKGHIFFLSQAGREARITP